MKNSCDPFAYLLIVLELKTMIAYNYEERKYLSLGLIARICWCAKIVKNTVKRKKVFRRGSIVDL